VPATETVLLSGPELVALEHAGVDAARLDQVADLIAIASALEGATLANGRQQRVRVISVGHLPAGKA
jgi:hypothetical protein